MYVWFLENTKKIKKEWKENWFSHVLLPMKNIKENQIWLKLCWNSCI